jgi:ATP-dependent DNA ligase
LLERSLARAAPGLRFNEHLEEDGVFHHACKLGLEGIVLIRTTGKRGMSRRAPR